MKYLFIQKEELFSAKPKVKHNVDKGKVKNNMHIQF